MATITKSERKAATDLAHHLSEAGVNYLANPFALSFELIALARRLDRYNEIECNYGLTEHQQANIKRLKAEVRDLLPSTIGVTFDGDPRGFAIKLHFSSGAYNTWGGRETGWGI